jgi:HEAT repeat protein
MKYTKIYLSLLFYFVNLSCLYAYEVARMSNFLCLKEAVNYNRLSSLEDLRVSTPWELPLTLTVVENIFSDPASNVATITDKVYYPASELFNSEVFVTCCKEWLSINIDTSVVSFAPINAYYEEKEKVKIDTYVVSSIEIQSDLKNIVDDLYLAILEAQNFLVKAINSLSDEERRIAEALICEKVGYGTKVGRNSVIKKLEEMLSNGDGGVESTGLPYSELEAKFFKTLDKFDLQDLMYASYLLMLSCERSIPKLRELRDKVVLRGRVYLLGGKILISGTQDDKYSQKDTEDVELLIDFGGNNTYLCNAGFAQEKQLRIVIDLGENVVVKSRGPAAGSGIYGIGLMYLPNPAGRKVIRCGSFSIGCGVFGVGGIFISGEGEFSSQVFSQGAGTFGLGVMYHTEATSSTYVADFFSQGAGMCKGVGLLYVSGDNIFMSGGFSIPDPREPSVGTTSMCQGVGYGVRAVTGGGVGLAIVKTNNSVFKSSYFAQGSGYWHGLGVFRILGDNNRLQARRYSQGAGIHTGCGMMVVSGNNNYTANWGVGPAYGWDGGVGIFISSGNDNMHRAEWGCGHGEINGRAISIINGNRLKLSLPNYGSGSFSRNIASYGISLVGGEDINICIPHLQKDVAHQGYEELKLKPDPWGIFYIAGRNIIFSSSVLVEEISFPEVSSKKEEIIYENEKEENYFLPIISSITVSNGKRTLLREIEEYLKEAAGFHTETAIIKSGMGKLLSLSEENVDILLTLLTPYSVEEIIVLNTVLSSYGRKVLPYVEKRLHSSSGMKKALLINLLSYISVENSAPILFSLLGDSDWRIRSVAARTLGYLFNHDKGLNYNHGRRTILEKCLQFLSECSDVKKFNKLRDKYKNLLNEKTLSDVYGILSLWDDFSKEYKYKIGFYEKTGSVYEGLPEEARDYFFEFLLNNRKVYKKVIQKELSEIRRLEKEVELKLTEILRNEKEAAVVAQVITALGELNLPDKATLSQMMSFLELSLSSYTATAQDKSKNITPAAFQEATISSLGRFGKYSYPYLKKCFYSSNEILSAAAITAAAHTCDKKLLQILKLPFKGCVDDDKKREFLQLTALATLANLKPPLNKEKEKLYRYFASLLKKYSSRRKLPLSESVKTAIQLFVTIH